MKSLIFCLFYFIVYFFFFNDTATTEIYTLSLHDALPISRTRRISTTCSADGGTDGQASASDASAPLRSAAARRASTRSARDRKSTRLNSSHSQISYAVFCLKKKKR